MVNQLCVAAILSVFVESTFAQQQDPAEMQRQMDSANVRVSNSGVADYLTPLKCFQTFFAALQSVAPLVIFESLTDNQKQEFFGTTQQPTQQQFDVWATRVQSRGATNFAIQSFIYTDNASRPQVSVVYTYLANVDGQMVPFKQEVRFVMADTAGGWKIDDWDESDLAP